MKRLKLCLIISIISNSALAQDIDINTFKYRYQKFRGLNYMLDLSGKNVFQTDKTTDQSSLSNYVSKSQKSPGLNFGGSLSADYFQLINTDKLQQSIYVNLSVENRRTLDKNTQTTQFGNLNNQTIKSNSHNRFIDYYGNFVIDQRLYYAGNRFLYFNANLSLSKNTTGIESETEIVGQTMNAFESDVRNNHYNIQLKAGWGKGRLEYVSDAVLAGFMIEDLKRKAMINEVSNETFMNIAKAITSIRNRRFTDMRFQLIDQIEMLDSQLQLNGITSSKQARYFTTLFDNWMFATQFARSTGKRLTYFIQADQAWSDYTRVTYGTSLSKNKWYNELSNRRAGIGVEYSNSWQKGLKVQH
ncbi:MAG: hypothetical protein JNM67_04220, partial [Bacteroidetes bacterium]|nr:hypothetical protein [Bacteroidota bacterium]